MDSNISLLIVDDEPSTRFSLSQIFRCQGHTVRSADEGFAALREMRISLPDIVLCDLNMPRMSGFELLSVIRRRFPQIYVIAMSGAFPRSGIPEGIAADAFYSKGAGLADLFSLMKQAIELRAWSSFGHRKVVPAWVASTSDLPTDVKDSAGLPMEVDMLSRQGSEADRAEKRVAEKMASKRGSQVLVGCPECLRAFPVMVVDRSRPQTADCLYCSVPVNYSAVL